MHTVRYESELWSLSSAVGDCAGAVNVVSSAGVCAGVVFSAVVCDGVVFSAVVCAGVVDVVPSALCWCDCHG